MVENPEDRSVAAREAVESLGCKLHGIWYAFGEFDGYFLVEAPDNSTAVALSATVASSGAMNRTDDSPGEHGGGHGGLRQGTVGVVFSARWLTGPYEFTLGLARLAVFSP
jgi:GYD domain